MSEAKVSPVESLKLQSDYLRGTIAQELRDGNDGFSKASSQLLKHHGTYQQDNRDDRAAARKAGESGKSHSFMVRTRIPGGKLTSRQLLAELDLCDELGNTTLRITSRQGLQLHGVLKHNLREAIRRINEVQLTTLAACGDVQRNVMGCPAPYKHPIYQQVQDLVDAPGASTSRRVRRPITSCGFRIPTRASVNWPAVSHGGRSRADLRTASTCRENSRSAVGFASDNCIDIYTHDLGFLAVVRDGVVAGYNVLVGGGMGVTPSNKATFPALAQRMAFITPDQALDVAEAVVKVQRDFGNRADRKIGSHEVPDSQLGTREIQGARWRSTTGRRCRSLSPTTLPASTTTWAGTNRATESVSTA